MNRTLPLLLGLFGALLTGPRAAAERARSLPDNPPEASQGSADEALEVYRVQAGDTLSGIARRFGTPLDELLSHNPDLQPDRIREGQAIKLREGRRKVEHRIASGETVSAILGRYGIKLAELRRWNPSLQPDRIRAGQTLLLYTEEPASTSASVGSPVQGTLLHAEPLPGHPAYLIRERSRAWGTLETVRNIVHAFDELRQRDPKAPRLKVHDLSLHRGGAMADHHSHQSGRDADIAYFRRSCSGRVCDFRRIKPADLDAPRTWALLRYWLQNDQAEAIFIDYALQGPLYRAAKAEGASAAELHKWFQYPHGAGHPLGVVRHFPKHDDHMHVRFTCHESDPECVTFRPLLHTETASR